MGEWLPLMEFATRNSVSLSTLRRQIKSGKIEYRSEGGKYLLWNTNPPAVSASSIGQSGLGQSGDAGQIAELQSQLKKAREEIAELKTLLAFYEEQPPGSGYSV